MQKSQKNNCRNIENTSYYTEIKSPFAAYFLGFLWADGTVSRKTNNIKLKIVNDDFNDIKNLIFKTLKSWRFRVESDGHPNHKPQAVLEINNKQFRDFLVYNDYLIKSGASAKKILSKVPDKFEHYWWRGYFDGDGGFGDGCGKTRRITLSSTLNQNWDFAYGLCKELGIGYRLSKWDEYKHSGSCIVFENEAWVRKFFAYIYKGRKFGLTRKYFAYLRYLEYKKSSYPNKTSKYRGVRKESRDRKKKWIMAIYKGKQYSKYFYKEIDAAREYDRMAKELYGNKAVLNFPNE